MPFVSHNFEIISILAFFISASLFISHAINALENKNILKFIWILIGFLSIQYTLTLPSIIKQNNFLIFCSLLSIFCALGLVFILFQHDQKKILHDKNINFEEILEQLPGLLLLKIHKPETDTSQLQTFFIADCINEALRRFKNALYWTKAAGKGEISISLEQTEKVNLVHFKDKRKGVSPDTLPHIFERFYSQTPFGAGVGLSFCQTTMQSLGGDINCESVENEYTGFLLNFPGLEPLTWEKPQRYIKKRLEMLKLLWSEEGQKNQEKS